MFKKPKAWPEISIVSHPRIDRSLKKNISYISITMKEGTIWVFTINYLNIRGRKKVFKNILKLDVEKIYLA